jgi:two-component system, LytTR family, response regulator
MTKLTAIITDDERHSREAMLQKLQKHCPDVEVLAMCSTAQEGIEAIKKYRPDVMFLDIEMPVINGFEMLKMLHEESPQIIFTTAYNEFAIQAIRYSALDYLVKPVEVEELKAAVARAQQNFKLPINQQLKVLMDNLSASSSRQSLAISTAEGLHLVNLSEIHYLEAEGNYTRITLQNHKILSSKTLGEFEDALPNSRFFRVHHSSIIHLEHLKQYIRGDGGEVVMQDGKHLPVARRRKDELLEKIKEFAGRV